MRMWMVDPRVMCNQHLLGEHVELHMTVGCLAKGYERTAYALAQMNLLELDNLGWRHADIRDEMLARGMNHQSPLTQSDIESGVYLGRVDVEESYREMARRCEDCRVKQQSWWCVLEAEYWNEQRREA